MMAYSDDIVASSFTSMPYEIHLVLAKDKTGSFIYTAFADSSKVQQETKNAFSEGDAMMVSWITWFWIRPTIVHTGDPSLVLKLTCLKMMTNDFNRWGLTLKQSILLSKNRKMWGGLQRIELARPIWTGSWLFSPDMWNCYQFNSYCESFIEGLYLFDINMIQCYILNDRKDNLI